MVIYNAYRHRVHGEEVVVNTTTRLLREAGVEVTTFTQSTEGLSRGRWKKVIAGLAGIYNPRSERLLFAKLSSIRPNVVHMHNLYPWISPSALVAASRANVPAVMTVHHYGLTCPILTHFRAGKVCVDCLSGREWNCVRNNCRQSVLESGAYALRSVVARKMRWFMDRVGMFIALSQFAKSQLVGAGFPESRIVVRPNMVFLAPTLEKSGPGEYVAYVGRITFEKGVDILCEAAGISGLPVHVAGDASSWPELAAMHADSSYVLLRGVLRGEELEKFYREARYLVVPSRWWEVCPIVVLEAMNYGCPVLAAAVGGLPELIDDGYTGMLFRCGDHLDLANKMRRLWDDEALRTRISSAAKAKVSTRFSEHPYLEDLQSIYQQAIAHNAHNR